MEENLKKLHDNVHGFRPVRQGLNMIYNTAIDIIENGDWSKAVEIRNHVEETRRKLDAVAMEVLDYIVRKEREAKDKKEAV